jgi:hypothetical protein
MAMITSVIISSIKLNPGDRYFVAIFSVDMRAPKINCAHSTLTRDSRN